MSRSGNNRPLESEIRRPPATSPEERENRMIALSMDIAEQQLRDGTASSQVITHFLKLASQKEKLELEKIRRENELMAAKVEAIQSAQRAEEKYEAAIKAMREYSGQSTDEDDI